jgi:3alpha(or 20beta)-hydroxysteroid dehydrogenase
MTGRLAGRTAVVTGAARGTGAEIARLFAEEGARVIATDVRDDLGTELGLDYRRLDVTSEDDWHRVVGELDALDVLVNNAAVLHLTSIDNTTLEIFEHVLRVNATGPFLGTRTCLPLLRQSEYGSIVNIGSIDSVTGVPATVAYTSSKFALRGLTKVTALENGKYGVRCNIVCPAAGNAEMYGSLVGPPLDLSNIGERRGGIPRIPLGRSRGPVDVAGAALFFASDDSRFCTGTELVVDGGATAGEYVDVPGQFSRELASE